MRKSYAMCPQWRYKRDSICLMFKVILSSAKTIFCTILTGNRKIIHNSFKLVYPECTDMHSIHTAASRISGFSRKRDHHSKGVHLNAGVEMCPNFLLDLMDCVKKYHYDGKIVRKYFPIFKRKVDSYETKYNKFSNNLVF